MGVYTHAPLRTVSAAEAQRLFRLAFDGRSVEEMLMDVTGRSESGMRYEHGLHASCLREAAFNKLLLNAREKVAAQRLVGMGKSTTIVSREKMTTEDGRGFVKVKLTKYWLDGRVETDVSMKRL